MTTKDILMIAAAILSSVGGSGVIICAISSFLAERIAKRIDNKYQMKLDQELEKYRSILDQRKYVSQTQFDYEFQIYKKLSKAYLNVVVEISSLAESYEKKDTISIAAGDISKKRFEKIVVVFASAQNLLLENAAFIPEDIYNDYNKLYEKANTFFWKLTDRIKEYPQIDYDYGEINIECDSTAAKEIETELGEVNKKVRKYLESLTIISKT